MPNRFLTILFSGRADWTDIITLPIHLLNYQRFLISWSIRTSQDPKRCCNFICQFYTCVQSSINLSWCCDRLAKSSSFFIHLETEQADDLLSDKFCQIRRILGGIPLHWHPETDGNSHVTSPVPYSSDRKKVWW